MTDTTVPVDTSEPEYPMANRWAMYMDDRRTIEEFIEWCEARGWCLQDDSGAVARVPDLLNEFHEINPTQLDDERRKMLAACAAMNEGDPHAR